MRRLGPYRALDRCFSVRAHRLLSDDIGESLTDLRCPDDPRDTLSVRRSRRAGWTLAWRSSTDAPLRIDGVDDVVHEVLASVSLAAATSAAKRQVVLHGGAVSVDGRGIAFLGGLATASSTLTAAAVLAGHGYLADQVVAVDGDTRVRGFHRPIAVGPDVAASLGVTCPFRVGGHAPLENDVELDAIFIVRGRSRDSPARLDPADALVELTTLAVAPGGFEAGMFRRLESIARRIPVYELHDHDPADALRRVRDRAV